MSIAVFLLIFSPYQSLVAHAAVDPAVFTAGAAPTNYVPTSAASWTGTAGNVNTTDATGPTVAGTISNFQNPNNPLTGIPTNPDGSTPTNNTTRTAGVASPNQVSAQNGGTGGNSLAPSDGVFDSCGKSFSPSRCVLAFIYAFTIGIGSVFAYVAAYFFNIAINLSLSGPTYGLDFISTSWTTARDLGNMAFLFILLYIAFLIIFNAETSQTKTMLATVIIVALLVNFSFFFTRVVIDASNILAIQFYNAIPAPPISQTIQGSPLSGVVAKAASLANVAGGTKDLTAGVMNMLNVQGLLNSKSFEATGGSFVATMFIYIAGAIVLWILTVAFFTNGVKFLFRVVVLWMLIAVSPLALISIAIDGAGGNFKKWRDMLVQHAFYPVAFMFVFLILNNFAVTMANNTTLTGGVFTSTQTVGASTWPAIGASLVSLLIRLSLVIGLLYIAMQVSTRFSLVGASYANRVGGWFGDKLKSGMTMPLRLTARSAGGIYAGGVGSAAYDTAVQLKNTRFGNTRVGTYLRKGVLEPVAGSKFGGAKSYADVIKTRKSIKTDTTNGDRDLENKETIEKVGKQIAKNINSNLKATSGISDEDKKKVQGLNKRDLESMSAGQIKEVTALLTEDQMKRVKEMEKLTDKEKEEIENDWHEHSSSAPVNKASKALIDLKKANGRLSSPDPDILANTSLNTHVNKALLDGLKTKVEAKLDEALANKTAAAAALDQVVRTGAPAAQQNIAKAQFASAEAEHRNAAKMAEHIKTAEEQAGKVQPQSGGVAAAGEFKIKDA